MYQSSTEYNEGYIYTEYLLGNSSAEIGLYNTLLNATILFIKYNYILSALTFNYSYVTCESIFMYRVEFQESVLGPISNSRMIN